MAKCQLNFLNSWSQLKRCWGTDIAVFTPSGMPATTWTPRHAVLGAGVADVPDRPRLGDFSHPLWQ